MASKDLIIIGRSPFITAELLEVIKKSNAIKIAINQQLQWCDYIAHTDRINFDYGNAIPLTVIAFDHIDTPEKYNPTNKDYIYLEENKSLTSKGFTHDFCVSWGIYKGFDKIILAGAADFMDGGHYNTTDYFKPPQNSINESIKYINQFDNVYTLNPNSKLDVKRFDIIELLKL